MFDGQNGREVLLNEMLQKCSPLAFKCTSSRAYMGEAVMKAVLHCQRENNKDAAVRRLVGRGLEMLRNSKSIQIKWLLGMERSIYLT